VKIEQNSTGAEYYLVKSQGQGHRHDRKHTPDIGGEICGF
jgi:hypothetical protein